MKKQYSNQPNKHTAKTAAPVNKKQARKPLISALEPRLLLDGAAVATAVDVLTDSQLHDAFQTDASQQDTDTSVVIAPTEVRAADPTLNNGKKEVVFIEDNVADYQTLIDGIGTGIEIVLLDSTQDGLAQMAQWAQSNSDYDAIHIISHGAEGQVNLGGFSLDNITVNTRSADLAQLGAALNEDGDLLLYGCEVASGEGQDFITALAQATQADVAASDDLTGAESLGGDWVLEDTAGSVETVVLLNESYSSVLADETIGTNGAAATSQSLGAGEIGQTFTATKTGLLKEIHVASNNNDNGSDWTLTVYSGEGTDGTVLATQTGTSFGNTVTGLSDYTYATVTLSTTVNLTSGSVYTFVFSPAGTIDLMYTEDPSAYASGSMVYNGAKLNSHDLIFQVVQADAAPANNAPTITGAPTDITVTEDTASNINLSNVTFADSDGDNLTVTLTASAGTLAASSGGSVTVSGSGTGALTLSGTAANINTYLDTTTNIQYTGASNASGDNAATLSIKANDGTVDSSISTVNIDITAVNDAPTAVSPTTGIVSTLDNANVIVATVGATDVDDSAWKYSIQSITLNSVTQTNDGSLFNFATDAATLAATNALRATTPSGLTAGTYIVTVVATDEGGLAKTQEISITVTDSLVVTTANDTSENAADADNGGSYAAELADGGGLSLREALRFAQAGGKTIAFGASLNSGNISLDSTVNVAAGTIFQLANGTSFTISGSDLLLNGGLTINNASSNNLTLSANLTDNGVVESSLTKTGAGTLILGGTNNTATGGDTGTGLNTIVASDGRLQISTDTNLGTDGVTLSGGVTFATAANILTVDNGFAIETGGATFNQTGSGHLTLSNQVSGDGLLTKSGGGSMTLSANNDGLGGGVTINNGTLNAKASVESLGYGAVTLAGGTLAFSDAGTVGNAITASAAATISNSTNVTLSGQISGSGALTKAGAGTMTLSGSNTHSGAVTVSAGTLAVSGGSSIGDDSAVTVNSGATLSLTGGNETIGSLSGSGAVALTYGLTVGNASNTTFSGGISSTNTSGITKVGAGTLTLSGANTYTGSTTVSAGTLVASGGSAIADTSALTVASGATFTVNDLDSETVGSIAGAGNIVANGGTLTVGGNNNSTTFSGVISEFSETTTLNKIGSGTLTLSGANTYTGTTSVLGGALSISGDSNLGSGALTLNSGTLSVTGDGANIDNAISLLSNGGVVNVDTGITATLSGVVSGTGALTKSGVGVLTLTGSNAYTGTTTVSAGTLVVDNDAALGTTAGGTVVESGATLQATAGISIVDALTLSGTGVNGAGALVASGNGTVTASGAITLGAATTVAASDADTILSLSNNIAGTYGLTKAGTGMLSLGGNSQSFTTLTIGAGSLSAGLDANLGSGAVILEDGTLWSIANNGGTIDNAIVLNGSAVLSASLNTTLAGGISGSGSLTKQSNGTLTLSGGNSYTGTTTITGGTLAIGGDGNLGTGSLTMNGGTLSVTGSSVTIDNAISLGNNGGTVNNANAVTLSGLVSGTGALTKAGTGVLTLSGNNADYSGNIALNQGVIIAAHNNALGNTTGSTAVASGTTLRVGNGLTLAENLTISGVGINSAYGALKINEGTGSATVTGNITLAADSYIGAFNAGDSLTLSGVISGGFALTKVGAGTLALTGVNTYSGVTTVSAGTLVAGSDNALGTTTAGTAVSSGAKLELSDGVNVAEAVSIAGIGGLVMNSGSATLSGDLTLTADARVTINGSATLTSSGTWGGVYTAYKMGTGSLILSGTNSGATTTNLSVSSGNLYITDESNLVGGALTLNTGASGSLTVTGSDVTISKAIALGVSGGRIVNDNAVTVSGVISGTGSLAKFGAGTVTLSGTNTYTGATTVSAGTLSVTGSLAATSGVTVSSGATLAGSGSVFAASSTNDLTVNSGGFLAPGVAGAGTLTVNGDLILNGTLNADITGTTAGSGYDQVVVTGDVTLGTNSAFDVAYSASGNGNTFVLINNQGANGVSGTLSGVAQGGTLTSNSRSYQTSYLGGTGNDVTLTDNSAPVVTSGATGSVDENAATSTVIYTVTATDADNDALTYSLTGTDASLLDINASTGVVTLKASADYETKSSYSFNVVATDTSSQSSSKAVTVSVNDLNDNTPVITSGATGSVDENVATSTVIYTVTATDADGTTANNTLTYSLTGTDASLLNINASTGVVTLKASANFETKSSYSFNVVATDNGTGSLTDTQAVTVSVNDVNEAPVITSGATGSVDENAATSTVIYTATATDVDSNTLTYSLTGTDASLLDINASTGVVTLKASANFETKSSYSFNVVATDNGTGSLTDTQAVTVSVNDVNEAPVITSGTTGSVDENAATSTVIYTATATDVDSNTLTYSLTGTDASLLDINASTGVVTLKASADYETKSSYSFNVVATDNGTGSLTDTQAVTVSVNDLNDNTPVITSGATGSVDENAATSTVIYTVTGTDADGTSTNNTLTYSLTGTDASLLDINASTGVVTLKASADYETKSSYSFNVVATDNGAGNFNSGSLSVSKAVTVSVNDLNDNTPVITSGATGSVDENAATSTVIYTVTATDADGTTANNTLTYSLTGTDASLLDINASTGVVTLKASANFETKSSYSFNVVATDNGTGSLTDTQAVTVSVNDVNEAPVITSAATGSVDENAATSTVIYTVTATDADGTTANNTLTYSLTGTDASLLDINASTGVVTLKASANFETKSSYSFNVVATDNGTGALTDTQAVTVSVNDVNEAPVITSGTTGSVNENAATSTVIYTATATDVDSNTLTYSLTGTDASLLDINASTGVVTLKASANFETKSSYSFNVVATDNGTGALTDTQAVTVSVNDVNEAPVITSGTTGSVDENAATSTVVYTATATDVDSNTLTYSLTGTDASLLDINASTGVVTLKASADYETKSSYSFNVVATDNGTGSLTDTQAVTVSVNDLNDNTPVITSGATGSVDENAATSTVIYTVTGTDADGTSTNNTLTYSLTGTDASLLDINASTGVVTLKASADYETKSSYSFNVVATDNGAGNFNSGSLSVSKAVTVSVNDLNDNTPVITSGATGSVDENAATSTVIYTVTATDADGTTANNTLTYSLTGTDASLLDINASTGVVTLKASANFETKSSYSFNVVATDNGTGSLTDTQAVTVSVNDVNEAPVITSGATGSVDENAVTSTVIYTATATDVDSNTLTYSLTGTDASLLDINASTGVVTLKASANFETKSSYSFNVVATDNGTGSLTDTQAVTVSVNDVNEAPVITSGATGSVDENAATSTVIYTATATDVDSNTLTYSLTGTDASLLDINASTGVVTLKASANFETKSSYSFNVVATDNGTGSLNSDKAVTVSVNDVNEAPIITGVLANMSGTSGQIFTPVTLPENLFTDPDANDQLVWSIENLPTGLVFNAATRTISGTPQGGFEGVNTLQVVATDIDGAQVKVPVTLTLNPAPAPAPASPTVDVAPPAPVPTQNTGFSAPDVTTSSNVLPAGVVETTEGSRGFTEVAATPGNNQSQPVVDVPVNNTPNVGQTGANTVVVSESRVAVNVGANGQVQVTEASGVSTNTTGLTVATIVPQGERVSITIADTSTVARYSGTLADGTQLPDWVEVNPTTGEVTMTPPQGQGTITLKINAVDADGNTRILEVEVDLASVSGTTVPASAESTVTNTVTFLPLDEQLNVAAEQFDDYGNGLMKLLVS